MQKHTDLQILPYYLSQYLWLLYIAIPILCSIIFPKTTSQIQIYSSKKMWNNSENPTIFAHISDSHINPIKPRNIDSYKKMIPLINLTLPEFIIHTGDIVDNYDSLSILRYGDQDEQSWSIYKQQMSNLSEIPIIEMAGNHDIFGIKSVTSNKNHIIDYTSAYNRQNIKEDKDFTIKSFSPKPSGPTIIVINPIRFPTAHPPLHLYVQHPTELLDRLESEINKSKSKCIIASHFPVGSIHSQKSSSGRRFTDIIGSDDSIIAFLSGHSHPSTANFYHHGKGGIEIIGPNCFINSRFGVVSIDNGAVSWSMIDINNVQTGVITYPIPKEQISKNVIFNDIEHTSIRVVMFSPRKDHIIQFSIKENGKSIFTGSLKYLRDLPRNKTLYSFPLKDCVKEHGTYTLTFTGDFNSSMQFLFDETFTSPKEILTEQPKLIESVTIIFPIFCILLFSIVVIIPCNCFNWHNKLNQMEIWIETGEGSEAYWIVAIFFGFILMRARFQRCPVYIKIFALILVLYSICGPLLFFLTENLTGFVWPYGYFIDHRNLPSDYGIFYADLYLASVCFPVIALCSSFGVIRWSLKQLGDAVVYFGGIALNIFVLLRLVHETVSTKMTFTSIGFFMMPIIHIIVMHVWIFYFRGFDKAPIFFKNKKNQENNLSLPQLTSIDSNYMAALNEPINDSKPL